MNKKIQKFEKKITKIKEKLRIWRNIENLRELLSKQRVKLNPRKGITHRNQQHQQKLKTILLRKRLRNNSLSLKTPMSFNLHLLFQNFLYFLLLISRRKQRIRPLLYRRIIKKLLSKKIFSPLL
jgi:hypothetical protein